MTSILYVCGMKWLVYALFRLLVLCFRITPFVLLYLLSDLLYVIIFHVVGYRKKVVFDNLTRCFPEKSTAEIQLIGRKFYRHLCDISIETIKGFSMSEKQLQQRYVVENAEIADVYFEREQNIICLASHYNNWEYGILALSKALRHRPVSLYLKLTNRFMEKYGTASRSRFGMNLVAVQQSREYFGQHHTKPLAVILAADQSPSDTKNMIWTMFLGRDTACLHGPEAYAKKMNAALVYFCVLKPRRGYYRLRLEVLHENPQQTEFGEITNMYMSRLEQDILKQPEYWLWSHRRWKHTRLVN
ncbi:MAG TPA: lysophospholipid acyltransferase family protein [Bacteroidales bacterium]|nr:lysophospholipid acyltransferase family protein [Bacteroidales bacterium]